MKVKDAVTALLLIMGSVSPVFAVAKSYFIHDIHIKFSENNEAPGEEIQNNIRMAFEKNKDQVWFSLDSGILTAHFWDRESIYHIKNQQVEIEGVTYTISVEDDGRMLRLINASDLACVFWDCVISMEFQSSDNSSSALQRIKTAFVQKQKEWQEHLSRSREKLASLPLAMDFPGIIFAVNKKLSIKLPLKTYNSMKLYEPETYFFRMGDNGIEINVKDKNTLIYRFGGGSKENYGPPHLGNITGEVFVVKTRKNVAYLDRWLASQKGILSRTNNGAIYFNEKYEPEVVYFQFDDLSETYLIARANVADGKLETVARAWEILRTMDPQYRGQDELSLADLALTEKELESRYMNNMSQLFDPVETLRAIEVKLTSLLEKPQRFIKPLPLYIQIPLNGDYVKKNVTIDIITHSASLDKVFKRIGKKHSGGKRVGDFLIYSINEHDDAFSWFYQLTEDLTLEFSVEHDSSLDFKVFLAQFFKKLDFKKLPKIPPQEQKNIFKYNGFPKVVADFGFEVREGFIDNEGSLLIPGPVDGLYSFEWKSPYIIATLLKSAGDNSYVRTDKKLWFDLQGKTVKKP